MKHRMPEDTYKAGKSECKRQDLHMLQTALQEWATVQELPGVENAFTFHSIEAALAFGEGVKRGTIKPVCSTNATEAKRRIETTDSRTSDPEWCEGLSDAQCYAATRSPTNAKRVAMDKHGKVTEALVCPMAPQPRRRNVKRLDNGDTIDAERFVTEHTIEGVWCKRQRTSVCRPAVRIAVQTARPWWVKNSDTARAAAAVLAIVKNAEDHGYAVEVDWVMPFGPDRNTRHFAIVPLKRRDEVLDWDTVTGFCVGCSTSRTFGWDLMCGTCPHTIGCGYGYGCHNLRPADFGHDIVSKAFITSDAEAREWVEQSLRSLVGV